MDTQKLPTCISLTLQFNAHANYYQTVAQWLEDQDEPANCWFNWVCPEERELAIANNSVWTCQWYPHTPVGFCALAASSLDVLLRAVNEP